MYSTHSINEKFIKILFGNPEGNRSLARHRCRWKDNNKPELKKIGCRSLD
jgi:hypothetical protein